MGAQSNMPEAFKGFAVIPSSTKRENLQSNLLAANITLSDDDLANINKALDCISLQGERYPASLANLQGK